MTSIFLNSMAGECAVMLITSIYEETRARILLCHFGRILIILSTQTVQISVVNLTPQTAALSMKTTLEITNLTMMLSDARDFMRVQPSIGLGERSKTGMMFRRVYMHINTHLYYVYSCAHLFLLPLFSIPPSLA